MMSTLSTYPNGIAIIKGRELYIFLYDDAHRAEMLRVLDQFASDPELSFTRCNAEQLGQEIREGEDWTSSLVAGDSTNLGSAWQKVSGDWSIISNNLHKERFHGEV